MRVAAALLRFAAVVLAVVCAAGAGGDAFAQGAPGGGEFSFFGVKFGMTKAEVAQKWLPLSAGVFAVTDPQIRQVKPDFDHEGRLYQFTFSVELDFPEDPVGIVNQAFQEALQSRWGAKESGLTVNLGVSRDGNQVTVQSDRLRAAYIRSIREKIAAILKP